MKTPRFVLGLALVAMSSTSVMGQSMNIDFNNTTGVGAGVPAASYGAAAAQPGFWNGIGSMTAGVPSAALSNLAGAATTATLTSLNANAIFSATGNGLPVGNDALLLQDVLDLGAAGSLDTFTFNNLVAGTYDIYVYAMAPDSATFLTNVNINAAAATGTAGVQVVGGTYVPGVFTQGITHSKHINITVTTGQMVINTLCPTGGGFGSLAGIQLVMQVPGPGSLALLGLAGMVGGRRRRN